MNDIHSSGSHLLNLINNVLDLSKIEAGKVELRSEDFDLPDVIDGVVKSLVPIAERRSITLDRNLADDVATVKLDKNKFRQILYNLLSNAIKFNNTGGKVLIETGRVNPDSFTLTVTDNGIGISQEDQKRLFIPFMQVDASTTRRHEGSGLGLALTKTLIELHGGRIEVESEVGQGTSFTVTLPLSLENLNDK
jgi:signal transduction histidine kinase